MINLDSILKSRDITLPTKVCLVSYGFSSGHVWMWELDYEESWVPKNWCFWTVVLEKTLESPLDCKEIQPVHSKGDWSQVFFGRNNAKAETPVLWPPHVKCWLIGKRLWFWEGLGAGGEGDDRGWDGWMASLTQWTWVWVNSGSWWWTGRTGMLQFMRSQRVGHNWVTELNWTELNWNFLWSYIETIHTYISNAKIVNIRLDEFSQSECICVQAQGVHSTQTLTLVAPSQSLLTQR